MTFPRLPDWLIYLAVAAGIIAVALARHEAVDAPEPPPPVPGEEDAALPDDLPFDLAHVKRLPSDARSVGTAFSVSADGVWLTSAEVARACRRPALMIAPGRGVEAGVALMDEGGVAVLQTVGGTTAIPVTPQKEPLVPGQRVFFAGYPKGRPGEAAGRLIGRRDARGQKVLSFAESGRTEGLAGALDGLAGSPAIDEAGRAVGVVISDQVRRGALQTTRSGPLRLAIAKARENPLTVPRAEPVTEANYYRVADDLRRQLSIVPVVCLRR